MSTKRGAIHVTFNGGALKVSYQIEADLLEGTLAAKLQFQLEQLKLNDRYKGQISKFLSEQRPAMPMFDEIGPDIFSEYLVRCSRSLENSFGLNDWRPALLRALAEKSTFLWFSGGILRALILIGT